LDAKLDSVVSVEDTDVAIEKANDDDTVDSTKAVDLCSFDWIIDFGPAEEACGQAIDNGRARANNYGCPWFDVITGGRYCYAPDQNPIGKS
jgi:hypothetical protein